MSLGLGLFAPRGAIAGEPVEPPPEYPTLGELAGITGWWDAYEGLYQTPGPEPPVALPDTGTHTVETWVSQVGVHFFVAGEDATRRPLLLNGLNGRPTLRFDGTNDWYTAEEAISVFLSAPAYTAITVVAIQGVGTNSETTYANDAIITDTGQIWGQHLLSRGDVRAYDWDGSEDFVAAEFVLEQPHVIATWLSGGNLYISIDNAEPASVASGSLSSLVGVLVVAFAPASNYAQIDVSEIGLYNVALADVDRVAAVRGLGEKWGITVA